MNIPNHIGFDGIADMAIPEDMKPVIEELVRRLELFRQNLFDHLRSGGTGNNFSFDTVDDATGNAIKVNVAQGQCTKE